MTIIDMDSTSLEGARKSIRQTKPYDYLVFIGRFQPFHYGHAEVIIEALKCSRHVIVLIGSANSGRSWRNPFTFEERAKFITKWWEFEGQKNLFDYYQNSGAHQLADVNGSMTHRLILLPLDDYMYNDQGWITAVQSSVDTTIRANEPGWTDYPPKVGLVGHSKDESSYYLKLFPQWGHIDVPQYTDRHMINATELRASYFDNGSVVDSKTDELFSCLSPSLWDSAPPATIKFLNGFFMTDEFKRLQGEHEYVMQYQMDHRYAKELSYVPTHTTVDAIVIQSGHVLLIERIAHPGQGLWALPGGFINPNETLKDGMLRELWEETKIKVPRAVLSGNIQHQHIFDDPNRSARGRIFSNAFLIVLPPQIDLPKLKGGKSSDAACSWWQPLGDLDPRNFFEDHWHIIHKMTGSL